MKCVMIVDQNLSVGLIANTTAVLGISLTGIAGHLTGRQTADKSNRIHEGVTSIPVPVLCLSKEELKSKYDTILDMNDAEIKIIGFSDVAQNCLNYNEYEKKLKSISKESIYYLGFCLYGPKKKINKLTGNLKLLR